MAVSKVFTLLLISLIVSSTFAQSPSSAPAPSPRTMITVTPSAAPVPSVATPAPTPSVVALSPASPPPSAASPSPFTADSLSVAQASAPVSAAALHRVGYAVVAAGLFAVSFIQELWESFIL